jgi:YYY domain-containing protein
VYALFVWWLTLSIMGWLLWPFAFVLLRHSRGRGYAYARALGLIVISYAHWLLGILGMLPNSPQALWGVALGVAAMGVAVWVAKWRELVDYLRREWRHVLTVELLFVSICAIYAAYKSFDPAIDHTEEPMDFAMLNGILSSARMPPHDPWLSGHSISYYYLGYLSVAVMTMLTRLPSGVAYNLGLTHSLALFIVGSYGTLYDLLALLDVQRGRARAWRRTALGGSLIIALGSNGVGPIELLKALGLGPPWFYAWLGVPGLAEAPATGSFLPSGRWWWWRASRVIVDANLLGKMPEVITEFPSFSFVLGDLHPHVMALPYAMMALGLALELYAQARSRQRWDGSFLGMLFVTGWLLGLLGFLNSWDLPTYLGLAGLAFIVGRWLAAESRYAWLGGTLVGCLILALGSTLPYLPFYVRLQSQAQGVGLAYYAKTPLRAYMLCLGLWLVPILIELWDHTRGRRQGFWPVWLGVLVLPWLLTGLLGGFGRLLLGLGITLMRGPWLLLLQSAALATLIVTIWHPSVQREERGHDVLLQLPAFFGLGLTYVTEFFYLRDLFDTRMNTMFKLHYQAWILLGMAAVLALVRLWRRGGWRRVVVWASLAAFAVSLYYVGAAAYTRAGGYVGQITLDGRAYLRAQAPAEYGAYLWLKQHGRPDDVIIEAYGEDFDASTSRLSAWTGIPTLLGWPGHEAQWRGDDHEVARRMRDIDALYTTGDRDHFLALARSYGATYFFVGSYERAKYGVDEGRIAWYAQFLPMAHGQDQAALFGIPSE